jgi:hypothetical protein
MSDHLERTEAEQERRDEFLRRAAVETNCLSVEDCLTGRVIIYKSKSSTVNPQVFRLIRELDLVVWLSSKWQYEGKVRGVVEVTTPEQLEREGDR